MAHQIAVTLIFIDIKTLHDNSMNNKSNENT